MVIETKISGYVEQDAYMRDYEEIIALTTRTTNNLLLKSQNENNTIENSIFFIIGE